MVNLCICKLKLLVYLSIYSMFTICILNVKRKRTFSLRVSKYVCLYIYPNVCVCKTTSRWTIYVYVN